MSVLQIADGVKSGLLQDALCDCSDAMNGADGQRPQELLLAALEHDGQPVWFASIAGHFRKKLVRGHADSGGQIALAENPLFQGQSERLGGIEGLVSVRKRTA